MKRHFVFVVILIVSFAAAAPAIAAPFPDSVPLPVDFAPEGIAVGAGSTFYAGSLTSGDIYRGDLRSGEGGVFIDAPAGAPPWGSRPTGRIACCSSPAGPRGRPTSTTCGPAPRSRRISSRPAGPRCSTT